MGSRKSRNQDEKERDQERRENYTKGSEHFLREALMPKDLTAAPNNGSDFRKQGFSPHKMIHIENLLKGTTAVESHFPGYTRADSGAAGT